MNEIPSFAWRPRQAAWPGTPLEPSGLARRHGWLATLRSIIATWGERIRFRRKLEQLSEVGPHLIDDIGLTRRQVETEIAKPFWRP